MSLRLSEPPTSRRARGFLRRWHKGPFRALLESHPFGDGGPVALVDPEGTVLAAFRGPITLLDRLNPLTRLEIGNPPIARLVGATDTLDPAFIANVTSLVLAVHDFEEEVDELSRHALERYRELSVLYDFSEKASSATALDEVMNVTLQKAVAVVRASGASLLMLDPETGMRRVLASVGAVPEISVSAISRVMKSKTPHVGMTDESLRPATTEGSSWQGPLACFPLCTVDQITGVLVVLAGPGRELRPEDQRLITAFASLAATRIEQARLTEASARRREVLAIGHLASAIVHDFKNPLTAVRGFAEMIQMPEIPVSEHTGLAEQIVDNADRMWAMVDEVLHYARGNHSTLQLQRTNGDELATRLARALKPSTPSRITLRISLSSLGQFIADVQKMERVIVNLVRNSFEAIINSGDVEVFGIPEGDTKIRIVVEDNGPGIPPGVEKSLFDPFITAGKSSGTGLGLAIVKKIVEDHQGSVTASPKSGPGARFVIVLPRNPQELGEQP